MKIEKSEMMSRERITEKMFSTGSSSSGKRTRESQLESDIVLLLEVEGRNLQ